MFVIDGDIVCFNFLVVNQKSHPAFEMVRVSWLCNGGGGGERECPPRRESSAECRINTEVANAF